MYDLRTFGGLALQRNGSSLDTINAQRKALALLAVLAAAGDRGIGREKVMALFWPESDSARARNALKQMLHTIRTFLGAQDAILGTAELRLNPHHVDSDVQRFRDALEAGHPEEAVRHYEGAFLDGVFLEGSAEFDRWLEQQRSDLERSYRGALERLAVDAEAARDWKRAVGWWRRLQSSDPLDGIVAVRLMTALHEAGDRAAALQHARVHELLVREEWGLEPEPAVAALAERIRSSSDTSPAGEPGHASHAPANEGTGARGTGVEPNEHREGAPQEGGVPVQAGHQPGSRSYSRRGWAMAAAALILLLFAAVTFSSRQRLNSQGETTAPPVAPSVAVLPFVDTSPLQDQRYLADGIAEEILNALTQVPGLRVPARRSSFSFGNGDASMAEFGERLGVATVLEGSVHRAGERIRITARLVDAANDRHIWSRTFDRRFEDIFAVQAEIASTVAGALAVDVAGLPRSGLATESMEAYEQYLRGLFHWNRRTLPDLALALDFFERAAELDAGYAEPLAGLALTHAAIAAQNPSGEVLDLVHQSAARALALDPDLASAHAARGYGFHWQWRWDDAEREYRRAIELNPGYSTAYQWYGEHLAKMGRAEEGEQMMRRAIGLDPLSLVAHNDLGLVLMLSGRLDEAIEQLEEVHRLDPTFPLPLGMLHRAHLLNGDAEASAEAGRQWATLSGSADPEEMAVLALASRDPRLHDRARAVLARWELQENPRWRDIAMYYAYLGDTDRTVAALERAFEVRLPMLASLKVDLWLDPIRGHPSVQKILRELAFP
jgi:TolB-like protein/DNA-binding SARP family transcriptional activator/Tfp pilus assembly protein PilF